MRAESPSANSLILLLTMIASCAVVGCASGLKFGDADPFLKDAPIQLVDQKPDQDERRELSESAGSSSSEAFETPDPVRSREQRGSDGPAVPEDELAELFDAAADAADAPKQSAPRTEAPPAEKPVPVIQQVGATESGQESFSGGLGDANPWGDGVSLRPAPKISLSFDDDRQEPPPTPKPGLVNPRTDAREPPPLPPAAEPDFPSQDSEFPEFPESTDVGEFPSAPAPSRTPAEADRGWRFGQALSLFDSTKRKSEESTAEKPKPRRTIRDRFSQLGRRFGLGDDEAPGPPVPVPETKPVMSGDKACLDDLIAASQARLAEVKYNRLSESEKDRYLRDHVNLRLMYLIRNEHALALDAIPAIPPAEQEFWQQVFWSLTQYQNTDAVPDRTERVTQTVRQLRTALSRLQETAALDLKSLSFCRRITGFGAYEQFTSDVFRPGQPVLVYAEVENFKSEPTTSGRYRTLLRSTLRIFPEHGRDQAIDSVTLKGVEDICRNPRRDYFNSYEFTMPNDIKPGRYFLELTLEDQLSGKTAQESVMFRVK